jgi:hypothetical protein
VRNHEGGSPGPTEGMLLGAFFDVEKPHEGR